MKLRFTARKLLPIVSVCIVNVFLLAPNVVSQDQFEELRVTIIKDKASFGEIAAMLIEGYDIPIGFVDSHNGSPSLYDFETNLPYEYQAKNGFQRPPRIGYSPVQQTFSLNFTNAPLGDVLDALVAEMPDYKWEITDGVVNFVPLADRTDVFKKLLEVNVPTFEIDQAPIFSVQDRLLELPALKDFLRTEGLCVRNETGLNPVSTRRKLSAPIRLSNITFRQLLNQITILKRGGWILRRVPTKEGTGCVVVLI